MILQKRVIDKRVDSCATAEIREKLQISVYEIESIKLYDFRMRINSSISLLLTPFEKDKTIDSHTKNNPIIQE